MPPLHNLVQLYAGSTPVGPATRIPDVVSDLGQLRDEINIWYAKYLIIPARITDLSGTVDRTKRRLLLRMVG